MDGKTTPYDKRMLSFLKYTRVRNIKQTRPERETRPQVLKVCLPSRSHGRHRSRNLRRLGGNWGGQGCGTKVGVLTPFTLGERTEEREREGQRRKVGSFPEMTEGHTTL